MRNCIAPFVPTLEQLREFRQTGDVPKVDVLKSAAELVPVRHPVTGNLLGYGERIEDDLNAVLDDLFFDSTMMGVSELVAKSAELDDDPLNRIFPTWLQPN